MGAVWVPILDAKEFRCACYGGMVLIPKLFIVWFAHLPLALRQHFVSLSVLVSICMFLALTEHFSLALSLHCFSRRMRLSKITHQKNEIEQNLNRAVL